MKIRKCISALLAIAFAITVFPAAVFAVGATETVTIDNGIGITAETTDSDIAASWGEGVATVTANSDGTYTVRLLKNIILRDGAVTPITFGNYSDGAEQPMMILDLNGCTVTGKTIIISNYGNLTITDSVGGGRVTYNNPSGYLVAVQNAGYNMIINSGEFECIGAGSVSYSSAISSTATSNTVINGGTFICENSGAIAAYGSITVNGGTFNAHTALSQSSTQATLPPSAALPFRAARPLL